MKLLIVASINTEWHKSLQAAYNKLSKDIEVVPATNEEALMVFLEESPDAVLITEYYDPASKSGKNGGYEAFSDIRLAASSEQVIMRSGFISPSQYNDFITAPFDPLDLLDAIEELGGEKEALTV